MKITGYGEDALSYWALQHQLGTILEALGDYNDPNECAVYFRPSFGRRGNPPLAPGDVATSSQFGEFDAIVASSNGVYLIETKWKPSSYAEGGKVILRDEQVFRHKVFRAYLSAWRLEPHQTWFEFSSAFGGMLTVEGCHVPIAPAGSQLAVSLERVLRDLAGRGANVCDVLLYMRIGTRQSISSVQPSSFKIIIVDCPSTDGFIRMSPADTNRRHVDSPAKQ